MSEYLHTAQILTTGKPDKKYGLGRRYFGQHFLCAYPEKKTAKEHAKKRLSFAETKNLTKQSKSTPKPSSPKISEVPFQSLSPTILLNHFLQSFPANHFFQPPCFQPLSPAISHEPLPSIAFFKPIWFGQNYFFWYFLKLPPFAGITRIRCNGYNLSRHGAPRKTVRRNAKTKN